MKPITQCLLVTASLVVLVLAILAKKPKQEPFVAELEQQVGIGVGAAVGMILLFIGLFFVFYNIPKEPNVIPRRTMYYNLE